jgi:hypothetical protein
MTVELLSLVWKWIGSERYSRIVDCEGQAFAEFNLNFFRYVVVLLSNAGELVILAVDCG